MNADILNDLATRVEAGGADMQARLFEESWDTLAQHSASFRTFACAPCSGFGTNAGHFAAMLEARAFESAAVMLVPDRYAFGVGSASYDMDKSWAWCDGPWNAVPSPEDNQSTTPALALTAAALRAHAAIAKENDR